MKIPNKQIREFHQKIFSWWEKNRRDLPWRHTHDPYNILVSEVMLQQTQVSRALPKYREFILEFPTVQTVAQSPLSGVLQVWKGMGYNRRAQYLQKTAKVLVAEYGGQFPQDEKELLALPGIGLYTARAIQAFAWKRDVAMVDTNIRQIIVHYFFDGHPQADRVIQETADRLLPIGKSWEWHQALMDFGAIAMPRIKKQSPISKKVSKKKSVAFKDSPRFIRGRIIDMLRTASQKESTLIAQLARMYGKPEQFVSAQLDNLIKEEMVERLADSVIRLSQS